jgi:hypothetical protein
LYSAVKKAVKQATAFLLVQTNDKQLSYSGKKRKNNSEGTTGWTTTSQQR